MARFHYPPRKGARRQQVWVTAALLCHGLDRRNQQKSLIGVFEEIQVGPLSIGERQEAIIFVSMAPERLPDNAEHRLELFANRPRGGRERVGYTTFRFAPNSSGHESHATIGVPLDQPGRMWIDVHIDGELRARTPIKITHLPKWPLDEGERPSEVATPWPPG